MRPDTQQRVAAGTRAIVSNDGQTISLLAYGEGGAVAVASLAPQRAVALAGELIRAACRRFVMYRKRWRDRRSRKSRASAAAAIRMQNSAVNCTEAFDGWHRSWVSEVGGQRRRSQERSLIDSAAISRCPETDCRAPRFSRAGGAVVSAPDPFAFGGDQPTPAELFHHWLTLRGSGT